MTMSQVFELVPPWVMTASSSVDPADTATPERQCSTSHPLSPVAVSKSALSTFRSLASDQNPLFEDTTPNPLVSRHIVVGTSGSTGAEVIATACPYCIRMLSEAVRQLGVQDQIVVRDLAELLLQSVMIKDEAVMTESVDQEVCHV